MVTSDFRPEVEIWQCRACAMKNMQYSPYLMVESPKFPRLIENRGAIFAFDFNVVNKPDGILNAVVNSTTALTSSSFVSEHFLKLHITITVIFYYNLADGNYTEEKR